MGMGVGIRGRPDRMNKTHVYDIAVVGAGPAGAMAAIRAGQLKSDVVLIERNDAIGKKIMITGKGRCNITNVAPLDIFIEKFGRSGEFLRCAFFAFFNEDLIDFFRYKGLELKVERQGRVFPSTDKAASIIEVLQEYLAENNVKILYNTRVKEIVKIGTVPRLLSSRNRDCPYFLMELERGDFITAKKVILATGGASYKVTGSTGEGFSIAQKLGHTIVPLMPGLVPLRTKEPWVKDLQGLALENIRLTFEYGKKKITSPVGELMFTHFGVSGPLVLDLSGTIVPILSQHAEVRLFIDLKPGLDEEQLDSKLLHKFKIKGSAQLRNLMKDVLPQRLIDVFLHMSNIHQARKANQITQGERKAVVTLLKAFPLTITGSLPIEEAMVTGGGLSVKEIDPRTLESRLMPGLYFAGEVIEGAASSGGYNLQQAFSTGYLAGEKAATCAE